MTLARGVPGRIDSEGEAVAEQVAYRKARRDDLPAIARIFLTAFPESILHYAGRSIAPRVMEDIFAICLDAEPEAFFVATVGGETAGYLFAPAHFSRLPRVALRHGHLLRLCWRWLTGQYGIGLKPARIAAQNWLLLLREAREPGLASDARILSIAVSPACQRRHLGTGLMQAGLDYLRGQGVPRVRLEVRPDNPAAIHLYEKMGFRRRGETHDTQGEWLILLKDMAAHDEE